MGRNLYERKQRYLKICEYADTHIQPSHSLMHMSIDTDISLDTLLYIFGNKTFKMIKSRMVYIHHITLLTYIENNKDKFK